MGCRELDISDCFIFSTEKDHSAAHFEYSPFGKIISDSGSIPEKFAFRFSSEYHDSETGLVYYNYRYYSPELGRWINRDPAEEGGGNNLYGFIGNNAINGWDFFGMLKDGEEIKSILVKRKTVKWLALLKEELGKKATGADIYGHWWIEFNGESYGRWPVKGVGFGETIFGVAGRLNGLDSMHSAGTASATKDYHHGDSADISFSPKVDFGGFFGYFQYRELEYGKGKGKKCRCVTEDEIKDSLREFAKSYSGSWS